MSKLFIAFGILIYSSMLCAATDETGKITRLIVEGNSMVSLWLSGADDLNECAGGGRWTLNSNDLLFKEKLSIIITAASSHSIVHLHGITGWGCGLWDSNKIYYIDINY